MEERLILSTLPKTWIFDLDGTLVKHNGYKLDGRDTLLSGAREYLDATLRFSMSEFTTKEEIDYTLETLYNCVPVLRKFTRR